MPTAKSIMYKRVGYIDPDGPKDMNNSFFDLYVDNKIDSIALTFKEVMKRITEIENEEQE